MARSRAWVAAEQLLHQRGAAGLEHPGGTLLAHLDRVAALLTDWLAPEPVRLAGLCHAAYGTDGFDTALLRLDERTVLADAIGAEAETLVYLYGSCDRAAAYSQLAEAQVCFVDRFTGAQHVPSAPVLRAFVEITAANELDVIDHNPELARQDGTRLARVFASAGRHLSKAARQAWAEPMAHTAPSL
jgi:hypothetical protein